MGGPCSGKLLYSASDVPLPSPTRRRRRRKNGGKSAFKYQNAVTTSVPACFRVEYLDFDVAHLLHELNITNAYLVGHSLGCRVVLQAWREAKGRVDGIVLVDGSHRVPGGGEDDSVPDTARVKEMEEAVLAAAGGDKFERLIRTMFEDMFEEDSIITLKQQEDIISRALSLGEGPGSSLFASAVGWDAQYMKMTLASYGTKLLVIQSTDVDAQGRRRKLKASLEDVQTSSWLQLVQSQVPDAKIDVVPSGHFVMMEESKKINQLILELVQSHCSYSISATFM